MFALRLAALLALGLWIGGLVALGAVGGPTTFASLEAQDPVAGRTLAGLVFGDVITRYQYWTWGYGLVVLLSLGVRAALGPRPRRFGIRTWTAAAMVAASLTTVYVITPRIDALRNSVTGSIASLPADDARRVAFGRWHGATSGLMLLTVLAGAGLIAAEARDRH